jgi:hypothetical protein
MNKQIDDLLIVSLDTSLYPQSTNISLISFLQILLNMVSIFWPTLAVGGGGQNVFMTYGG